MTQRRRALARLALAGALALGLVACGRRRRCRRRASTDVRDDRGDHRDHGRRRRGRGGRGRRRRRLLRRPRRVQRDGASRPTSSDDSSEEEIIAAGEELEPIFDEVEAERPRGRWPTTAERAQAPPSTGCSRATPTAFNADATFEQYLGPRQRLDRAVRLREHRGHRGRLRLRGRARDASRPAPPPSPSTNDSRERRGARVRDLPQGRGRDPLGRGAPQRPGRPRRRVLASSSASPSPRPVSRGRQPRRRSRPATTSPSASSRSAAARTAPPHFTQGMFSRVQRELSRSPDAGASATQMRRRVVGVDLGEQLDSRARRGTSRRTG